MNEQLLSELLFTSTRSSGPGGQNVNKVSTKVELRWDIADSICFDEEQKQVLIEKLANRINKEGIFYLSCDTFRSQIKNKEQCIKTFGMLLKKAFYKPKPRKASRPSASARAERLQSKKIHSEKKANRRKDW